MNSVTCVDLDGLISALEGLMDMPDSVHRDMLNAEADIVVKAQKREIESLHFKNPTGRLRNSIARSAKIKTDGLSKYMDVYPQGTRENGVRNAEVGFIHEFGCRSKGIEASHWMKNANEKCADEAVNAAKEVYDRYLDSLNQ